MTVSLHEKNSSRRLSKGAAACILRSIAGSPFSSDPIQYQYTFLLLDTRKNKNSSCKTVALLVFLGSVSVL
jgi:hypothetical protein